MTNFLKEDKIENKVGGEKKLNLLLFSYEKLTKAKVTRCEFIFLFFVSDLAVIAINNSRVFGISTSLWESCCKLRY